MRWKLSLVVAAFSSLAGLAGAWAEEKADDERPLSFELFDATTEAAPAVEVVAEAGRPLGEAETNRLLARLPVAEPEAAARATAVPSGPPPRDVRLIDGALGVSEEAAPQAARKALRVIRRTPEGQVDLAPNLAVVFSEPMVPLASDDELAREGIPVRLTPQPPGRWRWLDTRILLFEPEGRFPMATDYAVEVPAGTRSLAGNVLDEAVRWTFSTPAPKVIAWSPTGGPVSREPLIFIGFDQRVDPREAVSRLHVRADGQAWSVEVASPGEIEGDDAVRPLAKASVHGRWIAVRPIQPFPPRAKVSLKLDAGLPSAEGPRTTDSVQESTFRVHDALTLIGEDSKNRYGWARLQFSNPIDAEAFDPTWIRVSPAVEELKASVNGDRVDLGGRARPAQKYRVSVSGALRDEFGQTLGREASITVTTAKASRFAGVWLAHAPVAVADPAHPSLSVFSRNLRSFRLRAYVVEPSAWPSFWRLVREGGQKLETSFAQGSPTLDELIKVSPAGDTPVETRIDLGAALGGKRGHLVVTVEAGARDSDVVIAPVSSIIARLARVPPGRDIAWVQATHIGIEATAQADELLVWATSLADGRPLAGVEVELVPTGVRALTDESGLARLEHGETLADGLIARLGEDVAILPPSRSGPEWVRRDRADPFRWYVADDRGLYRPGEKVRLKGYLRRRDLRAALQPLDAEVAASVNYVLEDAGGNELLKGSAEINRFGAFDLAFELPEVMTLGGAWLRLEARPQQEGADAYVHAFRVEEFRRPEFELAGRLSAQRIVAGESVVATVAARYYTGGGLSGAKTRWEVRPGSLSFVPPGWEGFSFSSAAQWEDEDRDLDGRTNAAGEHSLRIATRDVRARAARQIWLRTSVEDINGQAWTIDGALVVLPARALVGLRSERRFLQERQPIEIDVMVVDPDGTPLAGRPAVVRAERLDWRQVRGEWRWVTVSTQERALTSAATPTRCAFVPDGAGQQRLSAVVADDEGREHASEITVWVGGKDFRGTGSDRDAASLTLDKQEYRPGEVAAIVVSSPFAPAQGLLTLRRRGVVHTQLFEMPERTLTLSVPIDESWMPNVEVHVELLSPDLRAGAEPMPAHPLSVQPLVASAETWLEISREPRRLTLGISPREAELAPGGETTIDLDLRDAAGRPVAEAEVAVWAVDEAVLALLPRELDHPTDALNPWEYAWMSDVRLVDQLDLASREVLVRLGARRDGRGVFLLSRAAPGAGPRWASLETSSGAREERVARMQSAVEPRKDFSPLAFFLPSIVTGADGRASVTVRLPDSLTRYRLFGLATDGRLRFGLGGGATLTARLPLMARPSPPRFLNRGDEFELPVVVQNDTAAALDVDVALRAQNLRLASGAGRSVAVPAHGRAAVRFPAIADRAGEAGFTVIASAGALHDSAELKVPVKVPVRIEQMAVYGQIDGEEAVRQVVQAPADALPDVGGVDVSLSPSALQGLSDAVLELATYEHECAEQISSRVLAIAALRDVLAALQAPGLPPADQLAARVQGEVQRLGTLQNGNGGFGFWRQGERSWPYVTIHVTHALVRARQKGFTVPASVLERATKYLARIDDETPRTYPVEVRQTLKAYALHVRHLLGEPVASEARELVQSAGVERLALEALGWLLPTLAVDAGSAAEVSAIRRHLANRVTETAGQAHFVYAYEDGAHLLLYSDRRTDAVVLDGLIAADPGSDLIPKLAAGLLAQRQRGAWSSTQEDAFVLLAMDRYFRTFEKASPDFVARLWWGKSPAGQRHFSGHSATSESFALPMAQLKDGRGPRALILSKEGSGRLYYRIGLRHASSRIDQPAVDHGLGVTRSYRAVDDPRDVRREEDGRWRFRAGARVRVRVTLVVPAVRHHVALVDPLPAGLEPLNPLLALSDGDVGGDDEEDSEADGEAGGPGGSERETWWSRSWVDYQNLRDDRAEAFAATVWPGVYRFEYLARATTKGRFIAPAPRAEEMYSAETRGRGPADRVVVE